MAKRCLAIVLTLVLLLSCAAFAESTLDSVLQSGVLRVGIGSSNGGWSIIDAEGNWTGYDYSIAKSLADSMGVELQLITGEAADRIAMLQADKVDLVVFGFTYTPERAKSVAFTFPYATEGLTAVFRDDSVLDSWDEFTGLKIGVQRGGTADVISAKLFEADNEIIRYDGASDNLMALVTGKVDVIIEGDDIAYSYLEVYDNLRVIEASALDRSYICMATQLGDADWLNYVNTFILNNLVSGNFASLYEENFGHELGNLFDF